jgi:hypothetical protein
MRRLASLLLLLAGACDNGHPPQRPSPQNAVQPAPPPARPIQAVNESNAAQAPDDAPARNDPGLADLTPAQRRAYDLGYRDCSHGHYAPENRLEAYRIGCGAAHERMEEGRP